MTQSIQRAGKACPILALVALLTLAPSAAAGGKKLTLEAIFTGHGLLGPAPSELQWSPDGRWLSYMLEREEGGGRDLWAVDAETGEKRVLVSSEQLDELAPPPEEAARNERDRERRLRYSVDSYIWSPDSLSILFASAGRMHLYDLARGEARPLAPAKRGVGDPKFSPNGRWVTFLYQHGIWIVPPTRGEERRLTYGGSEDLLHGELDWVYPEEFGVRSGYRWSPDSKRLAFYEIDQSEVSRHPITNLLSNPAAVFWQRYPKAGTANPKVRIGVIEAGPDNERPQPLWIDTDLEYIPRFKWVDPEWLAVQALNRAQRRLELFYVNVRDGRRRDVLAEEDSHWLNVSSDWHFLKNGQEFVWTSESGGHRHIYVYGHDGRQRRALTHGEWEVKEVAGVDEKRGWVYYVSNEENPIGASLYRVSLDGETKERLTAAEGSHEILMNDRATAFADTFSSLTEEPAVRMRNLDAGLTTEVHRARSLDEYELGEPELRKLETEDGALVRLMLRKPEEMEAGKRYPALLYVYGGPAAPVVRDTFGASRGRSLFHEYLTQQGYVVCYVDDRASSRLGHRFETALWKNYGPAAVRDYAAAVEHLRSLDYVDPERIGIWGWSAGGTSTLMAMAHTKLFTTGVAVAPVTDWSLYDTIYTERYMGRPQENPQAYGRTSALKAAPRLHGRLLLVHPTADDNVHLQNTIQMADALIEAGKAFDLSLYPGKTHSIHGSQSRLHLFWAIERHLNEHLRESRER